MKNVISASRRTDIPAYYLKGFIDALKTGYVEVANPVYRKNRTRVFLDPDHVEWIVFWSRNYGPFLKQRAFFGDYSLFFHFTILPASILEKNSLPLTTALTQAAKLAEFYGPDHIIWRYDPIVHWINPREEIQSNHKINQFREICEKINRTGITNIYFSFVSHYQKYISRFKRTFQNMKTFDPAWEEKMNMLREMKEIADEFGMRLHSCCNDALLALPGIQKGSCINGPFLNTLNSDQKISTAKKPSRSGCGCTRSIDIGDYLLQPCPTGCIYCYANPEGYS